MAGRAGLPACEALTTRPSRSAKSDASTDREIRTAPPLSDFFTADYLAFETELAHGAVPGWSLVGRIHHRSGGYGMLTERGSGSNFMGLGLRRNL
jgi:hypothetical protein